MREEQEYPEEEQIAFDAGDVNAVTAARKKEVRLRQKRINFVREMMNSEEGRIWVYDILMMGHFSSPTHTPSDPYSTAFKEGERNIANKILYDINEAAPELYMKMLIEGRAEK